MPTVPDKDPDKETAEDAAKYAAGDKVAGAARDAAAIARLDAINAELLGSFAVAGYERIEPPILQPADVFLDRSGEDIRNRMYVFNDPQGTELCLRADLTIPVCRIYLERGGAGAPARFSYCGPAFRYQPEASEKPNQFLQTGIEIIGDLERAVGDAEALRLTLDALARAGLAGGYDVHIGDLSLFAAFVDDLDMPPQWRERLKRQFWRPHFFRNLVQKLTASESDKARGVPGSVGDRPAFLAALGTLDPEDAKAVIRDVLSLADISSVGGRTIDEIAGRFLEQAADASAAVMSREVAEAIRDFLAISAPVPEALESIETLEKAHGARHLAERRRVLVKRFDKLADAGHDLSGARLATEFGRNMEYYTGFVFELTVAGDPKRQIAGGGRYDKLLKQLGAAEDMPAVGAAIRPEVVLDLIGGGEASA